MIAAGAATGLLTLIAIGVPIGFALGLVGLVVTVFFLDGTLAGGVAIGFQGLQSPALVAIPLFVLMSEIMIEARINKDLFSVVDTWLGRIPGGVGVVAVVTFGVFAALTGSSVATAMAIGSLTVPQMISHGYSKRLSHGVAMASGTFGIMIPPSIPLIVYALVTEDSIGRLFAAGIVPGVLTAMAYSGYVIWRARAERVSGKTDSPTWGERLAVTRRGLWGFLIIPIVLGGLYAGWFTPNEAAAAGVIAALVVALLIKRTVRLDQVLRIGARAARTTAMIFLIIVGAKIFSHALIRAQVPQNLSEWVLSQGMPVWLLLISLTLVFFVLGLFFDIVPIILMVVPVLAPIMVEMEINTIWFGIFLVKNMEVANITPPVGLSMNVLKGHFGLSTVAATRAVAPFIAIDVAMLVVLAALPGIVLWLPNLLYG